MSAGAENRCREALVSRKQFIAWLVVTACGLSLCFTGGIGWDLGVMILALAWIMIMTPAEKARPLDGQDVLAGLVCLLAVEALLGVPEELRDAVVRFIRHPGFVVLFCLLATWRHYCHSEFSHAAKP